MAAQGDNQYDPYIPAGGAPATTTPNAPGNQRTAALQAVSLTFLFYVPLENFPGIRRWIVDGENSAPPV